MKNTAITITLVLVIQMLAACATATGTALVAGTTRDPINPESVKIYLQEPTNYEVVAIVKAESDAGWTAQESQDYAVAELKNQAAKLGANGLLLGTTGQKTTTVVGGGFNYASGTGYNPSYLYAIPVESETVSGQAIYVYKE